MARTKLPQDADGKAIEIYTGMFLNGGRHVESPGDPDRARHTLENIMTKYSPSPEQLQHIQMRAQNLSWILTRWDQRDQLCRVLWTSLKCDTTRLFGEGVAPLAGDLLLTVNGIGVRHYSISIKAYELASKPPTLCNPGQTIMDEVFGIDTTHITTGIRKESYERMVAEGFQLENETQAGAHKLEKLAKCLPENSKTVARGMVQIATEYRNRAYKMSPDELREGFLRLLGGAGTLSDVVQQLRASVFDDGGARVDDADREVREFLKDNRDDLYMFPNEGTTLKLCNRRNNCMVASIRIKWSCGGGVAGTPKGVIEIVPTNKLKAIA